MKIGLLLLFGVWNLYLIWVLYRSGWLFPSNEPTRSELAFEYFGYRGFEAALKECDEAHLAGDCVLCGAK